MLPLSQGLIRMNSGAICAQPGSTTSAQGSVLAAGICGSNPNTTGGWMKWNNLPIFPWVMFGRKQIFYLQLHIWWPRRNAGGVWLVLLDSCCTWRTVIIICCLFWISGFHKSGRTPWLNSTKNCRSRLATVGSIMVPFMQLVQLVTTKAP